jgi:hypothetical protein
MTEPQIPAFPAPRFPVVMTGRTLSRTVSRAASAPSTTRTVML